MSKKLEFINYVQNLMHSVEEPIEMSDEASAFWEALKAEEFSKEEFTENDEAYYFVAKDKGTLRRFGKVLVSPYMLSCLGLFAVVVICKLNF